jgi:hypothetical protein
MSSKSLLAPCVANIRKFCAPLFGGLLLGLISASGAFAQSPTGTFRGDAYGTFANATAGSVAATLGRSAYLPCACEGTDGEVISNRIESLSAGKQGDVLTADEVVTTGFTGSTATGAIIKFTSTIDQLHVFDGLITATSIKAVSNTEIDQTTIKSNSNGSKFTNLTIDGQRIQATVSPNTHMRLPGIGHVILNKETKSGKGTSAGSLSVDMIVIHVTRENAFDLPVGSQIIIGHATSGFNREPIAVSMEGAAWATEGNTKLDESTQNQIGKAAFIAVPCNGTDSEPRNNTSAAVKAKSVLSIGAARTTAFGGPVASGATVVRLVASVDNVQLLNGRIAAGNVAAVARETISTAGTLSRSTQGSGFTALRVMGTAIPDTVPPNTKMMLPDIGFVILNEQIIPPASSDTATKVNGIHVFVTKTNPLGLPVGSQIVVAHAHAHAKKFPEPTPVVVAVGQQ